MTRTESLSELARNWPRMPEAQLQLIDRRTRDFEDDEFEKGVEHVLRNNDFPPTVADVYRACSQFRKSKPKTGTQRSFRPGDVVYGEQTMTPAEAAAELERLFEEHPDWFSPVPKINHQLANPDARRKNLEALVNQLWITALRRCASADPKRRIVVAQQRELFG